MSPLERKIIPLPPGIGFARQPPIFLQAGDVAEVEIEGLGVLAKPVRASEK